MDTRKVLGFAILLTLFIGIAIAPLCQAVPAIEEEKRPDKPLSVWVKEKYKGLQFVNTPLTTKEQQLQVTEVPTVEKVDATIKQKLATIGPEEKLPVIVQFGAQVAKPADVVKGSTFVAGFTAACSGAIVVNHYYPQVNSIEVTVTANFVDALSKMPQVVHIWDPTIEVKALNYDSTQYHEAVVVWTYHTMGAGAVVAILDTGWDGWVAASYTSHPDLQNLASPYTAYAVRDFTGDTDTPSWHDWYGHGTHVAGIAVGQGVVDSHEKGIAPQAKLMVGKVLGDGGSGYWSWVIQGLVWSAGIDPDTGWPTGVKANVVSMSLGGSTGGGYGTSIVEQVCDEIALQGTLPVAAAGNDGPSGYTITIPGSSKNALAVGATYQDLPGAPYPWKMVYFSSRGPTADLRTKPDISAIGYGVNSTIPPNSAIFGSAWPPYYARISGTSMSTPQVSGAAALLASGRPYGPQVDALKAMLLTTWETQLQDYEGTYPAPPNTAGYGFLQADDGFHTEFFTGTFTAAGQYAYFRFYLADGSIPMRIVLTWLDPSTGSTYSLWGSLVHDLDVLLYDPAGHLVSSSVSYRNNVEVIDYSAVETPHWAHARGIWTIRVNYFASRPGYSPIQHFAVALRSDPTVAPIRGVSILTGTPAPYMRPYDTMLFRPTLQNLRTDSWNTGGGQRMIFLVYYLWSPATGYVFAGETSFIVNQGQTIMPNVYIPLAPKNLPYGYYTLEVDAYSYYPTYGKQYGEWTSTGFSYAFGYFYLTPPTAATIYSVKADRLSYLRGQTAIITVGIRNVGIAPYKGTVSLLLLDPQGNVAAVIGDRQVSIAYGGTATLTVYWVIPTGLEPGPITYKVVASTGTQGWISSKSTNVIIT